MTKTPKTRILTPTKRARMLEEQAQLMGHTAGDAAIPSIESKAGAQTSLDWRKDLERLDKEITDKYMTAMLGAGVVESEDVKILAKAVSQRYRIITVGFHTVEDRVSNAIENGESAIKAYECCLNGFIKNCCNNFDEACAKLAVVVQPITEKTLPGPANQWVR